jgi:hypothetical protein
MNMPDIYLSHLSKNNLIAEQKNHLGAIPSAVAYKYDYVYDDDGYPSEVVTFYKSYRIGEDLYKTKTVYSYM